jgi:hypothetical protein
MLSRQSSKVVRRRGAEGLVNLARRRRWYTENENEETGADASKNSKAPSDDGKVDLSTLPPVVQEYIKELRQESAARRKELESFRSEASQREQQRLKEEGRWKELAEKLQAEKAQLLPYEERAQTLEKKIRGSNEARITRVPEEMRTLIPTDYPPERLSEWLDANWERLSIKPAPDLDAGAGGGSGGKHVTLTDDERQLARKMGLTEEQYIASKLKMQSRNG